jgi:hypothetical protein
MKRGREKRNLKYQVWGFGDLGSGKSEKSKNPSLVQRSRSWTRPWIAEERFFVPELGALLFVPTLRVHVLG